MDSHFRSLPKDAVTIGPASSAPEAAAKTSATGAITIPVKIQGTKVSVPVTFVSGNGSVTGNLAVDTGASQTMISKRMARDLRLQSIALEGRRGIGGSVMVDVGRVDSIKVGDAEAQNMRVSIHDFTLDPSYEGLLGFDFLGRYQMSVDTEKQVMVLTPRKK
jgi:predicted aspartyl protease